MAANRLRIARNQLPAGGDPFVGNGFTLIVVFREVPSRSRRGRIATPPQRHWCCSEFFSRLLDTLSARLAKAVWFFAEAKPDGCEQPDDAETPTTRSRSRFQSRLSQLIRHERRPWRVLTPPPCRWSLPSPHDGGVGRWDSN